MVVAMAKCGRMIESEIHSPRLEVLRLYGRLDSYAYAFTCVPMEDMCLAATAPNGYQGKVNKAIVDYLYKKIMSRVDGTTLLSWIVLFKAIAKDGDTINVVFDEISSRIARGSRVEIHNAVHARIAGMLLISDDVCEYQIVRTESRNVPFAAGVGCFFVAVGVSGNSCLIADFLGASSLAIALPGLSFVAVGNGSGVPVFV
nr:hypothetical protein [Tanacetum cinerariifolium]